jgi:hypothetical protein
MNNKLCLNSETNKYKSKKKVKLSLCLINYAQ